MSTQHATDRGWVSANGGPIADLAAELVDPGASQAADRPEGGEKGSPRLRSVVEIVSLVLAPASLLSALLFYFGWTYTNSRALYFGIDPSTFGYTTQDYLLRSVDPIFIPLGTLLLVAVILLYVHSILVRCIGDGRHRRLLTGIVVALAAVGCSSLVAGLIGVSSGAVFGQTFLVTPLSLCVGIGAVAYADYLHGRLSAGHDRARHRDPGARRLASAGTILVALFIVLNLFWAVRDWADAVGRGRASELAAMVPYRPGVVVYSKSDLHIDAPGVNVTEVGDAESAYRFRYDGLSMLIYSSHKYFLVATQSPPAAPTTIILPDRDDLRLEFTSRSLR